MTVTSILGSIHPSLNELHGLPLWVFLLVLVLTLLFTVGYLVAGTRVWRQLQGAVAAVDALKKRGASPKPDELRKAFGAEPLRHLWEEYSDTLHEMKTASGPGGALVEIRATVPAETLFTREVLVDSRLFDDFTRHLPGVLTGLGIIGTFAGLLVGLQDFGPKVVKVEDAVQGLGPLLKGVEHAFVASGVAIFCAMYVVFFSRLVLAYLYGLVERLAHGIDSLYAGGAGEDYLARLVKSSEQSAASAAQLKDALVEDLSKMMTNLVDRQIAAQEAATANLGRHLGTSISEALSEPLKALSEGIKETTRGNGEQVSGMLETLLTGFMAKLEDTFGGQIRGINEQMQRSMQSMDAVQSALQGLLADIQKTNSEAANQMNGALEDAMKKAASNQEVLTNQMREFVQEFRRLVSDEQQKSKQAMDDAMAKILEQLGTAMGSFEDMRKRSGEEERARNENLTNQTGQLVGGLTQEVGQLLGAVAEQVSKTQKNIEAVESVSLSAIDGMNQGALTMSGAAQRFETAGNSVSNTLERSASLSETLGKAAGILQAASAAVQQGFEQYDATRRTVDAQVASLTGLIESAKREAGVSQDLIASIKASAQAMRVAEDESRKHLEAVNEALVKSFKTFGEALTIQVKSSVAETDRHIASGVGHLSGVVQELATAVQKMKKA